MLIAFIGDERMFNMQFSITPVDLHHYDIFMLHPVQAKLFGKAQEKTYMGSATISLDGQNIDLYCENKHMKNYSEIIGKQAYSYYLNEIEKNA